MKQVIAELERKIAQLEQNIFVDEHEITNKESEIKRIKEQNELRRRGIEEAKQAVEILKAQ